MCSIWFRRGKLMVWITDPFTPYFVLVVQGDQNTTPTLRASRVLDSYFCSRFSTHLLLSLQKLCQQVCSYSVGVPNSNIQPSDGVHSVSPRHRGRARSPCETRPGSLCSSFRAGRCLGRSGTPRVGQVSCLEFQEVISGQERYCQLQEAT